MEPRDGVTHAALLGIPTFATSVTPRSSRSTPEAVREALERYSTYSWLDEVELLDVLDVLDHGDVADPDGTGGRGRVAEAIRGVDPSCELLVVLGGDNSATVGALLALAGDALDAWGLITLDAHLDLRDGLSNGSPVRELLAAGLDGAHVAQVGLADFSNSAAYAGDAERAGITVLPRCVLRDRPMAEVVDQALAVAGRGGRRIYVDVDLDVVDRSAVPGCPAAAPGGLSADELRVAVRLLAADARVRAIDVTEVDVDRDSTDERTVRLAALVVLEALAGLARRSPCP
jgi:formiminoglutamase